MMQLYEQTILQRKMHALHVSVVLSEARPIYSYLIRSAS